MNTPDKDTPTLMENETQTIPDDTRTPKADKQEEGERKENDNVSTEPKNALLEKEEGDCCSICLDELPTDATKFVRWTCCGNGMHKHCDKDLASMKMDGNCPLCRAKTPTSHEEMVKYIRPWVKKKKAWALHMIGQMYEHGTGVKQSYEMARRLFEQAAQQGYTAAMGSLGVMYSEGQGVEQSYEKAVEYYEQAAQQGDASAMYTLGVMYIHGHGVEQSYERAFEYYEQAADLGETDAIFSLGIMYYQGHSVEQSYEKAKEHYEQAAQLGHANAQYNLGRMYATGESVVKNETKAHALWLLAAAQGDDQAINMLPILEKNMTKS
jgi:hypothetical protein